MLTTITHDTTSGLITIRCGKLEIIVPHAIDDGADERAEIRCGNQRLFVEALDIGNGDELWVSGCERFTKED